MEPFQPVRTRGVLTDALNQILERIRSGRVSEGDVLPSERLLAAQMDVSRPTVRAALDRLTQAGIVKVTTGRGGGARITSTWIPDDLEESDYPPPAAEAIFGLLEARRTVEPRVAQLAALRGTGEQLERMEESVVLLREQHDDIRQAAQAESRFHRVMWEASGNPALERMMIDLNRELGVVREMMLRTPEDYAAGVELHEATLAAIRRGDPREIEAEMIRHLSHFEGIVEDVLRQRAHRRVPAFLLARAADEPAVR